VVAEDGGARRGVLKTPHGDVETPLFMPVATKGTVKAVPPNLLEDACVTALISNALHLYLRPGVDVVEGHGGIHRFMNFHGAIFTDSGGFQMLREGFLLGVREEGILFRSPYDGSRHLITPARSREMQARLGSDVAMALDHCPHYSHDRRLMEKAVERTLEWAVEFIDAMPRGSQMLFGIVQGGVFEDLRERCASALAEMDFDGYGIGGLSIGETREEMLRALQASLSHLPEEKPRYFMGLGSPPEILEAVAMGVDIFDSVYPTRNGRHATALTSEGRLDLRKGRYAGDMRPIEEGCDCYACRNFTRAYIRHLISEDEILAKTLVSVHNIRFLTSLMERTREAIEEGRFEELRKEFAGWK
jgi:queuine tRNA-ribosyltransferase